MTETTKSLEQALREALWDICITLADSYEKRPMRSVPYPFIDFEDSQSIYTAVKHVDAIGTVTATINIWDVEDKRENVSSIASNIVARSRKLHDAYGYHVNLVLSESNIQIAKDTTVKPPLWRAIVTLQFTT